MKVPLYIRRPPVGRRSKTNCLLCCCCGVYRWEYNVLFALLFGARCLPTWWSGSPVPWLRPTQTFVEVEANKQTKRPANSWKGVLTEKRLVPLWGIGGRVVGALDGSSSHRRWTYRCVHFFPKVMGGGQEAEHPRTRTPYCGVMIRRVTLGMIVC